jgi:hypothetical protein
MHDWAGSTISFLRQTERAGVDASQQAHRPANLLGRRSTCRGRVAR